MWTAMHAVFRMAIHCALCVEAGLAASVLASLLDELLVEYSCCLSIVSWALRRFVRVRVEVLGHTIRFFVVRQDNTATL